MRWLYSPADGPLAQLVEQGTLNPKVEGSNPSRPTSEPPAKRQLRHERETRRPSVRRGRLRGLFIVSGDGR